MILKLHLQKYFFKNINFLIFVYLTKTSYIKNKGETMLQKVLEKKYVQKYILNNNDDGKED